MKHMCTLIVLILLSASLTAQQVTPVSFDTTTVNFKLWEKPYVHKAFATDTTREDYNFSLAGNWLSFAGHAREATAAMEAQVPVMGMDTARYEGFTANFHPVPAAESLLLDAEQHEIVVINEAHHEPRHRVFTRSLLRGLYDRGYRHFGLETLARFGPVDSLLQAGHYPALQNGYYTREPQFAALVYDAVRIGFHVFGYEKSGTGSPKLRELGQMRNIMAYRAEHPEGKLLLHVGYSHATEGQLGPRWEKSMAQRLADTTGLDPLTINQTHFREMATKAQERFEYQTVSVEQPSLFVDTAGEHWNFNNDVRWFDRYVFHPRTEYLHGRPDYVFTDGRQPLLVSFEDIGHPGPYLVQAYSIDDDMALAVPRDVIETDGSANMALALVTGKYRLLVLLPDGQQYVGTVEVKGL